MLLKIWSFKLFCLLVYIVLMHALISFSQPLPAPERSDLYPEKWEPGYKDKEGHFLHDFSYAGYRKGETTIPNPVLTLDVSGGLVRLPLIDPSGKWYTYDVRDWGLSITNDDVTGKINEVIEQAEADIVGNTTIEGAIIYLPAGVYRVQPQLCTVDNPQNTDCPVCDETNIKCYKNYAIKISSSKIILLWPANYG